MLSITEFNILNYLRQNTYENQRKLADYLGVSLGKCNYNLRALIQEGLVSTDYNLTEAGQKALAPHRVENAVIMAAGMSQRFAPLSYERPKGLLVVKGEVLIERQIEQLKEAGINDITLVVGYMKEQFFYLHEKYDVDIVVNEDYYRYNNTSTLILVTERLGNTYICSSDNYFVDNPFEQYVYDAYYSAVFFPGEAQDGEFGLITDTKDIITGICHEPVDMWCMLGHVYFDKAFSAAFSKILKAEYEEPSTRSLLWESVYEKHLDKLKMRIRRYDNDKMFEFDSVKELRQFDERYLDSNSSRIFKNICRILDCEEDDICNIEVLKKGLTNLSFAFDVFGKRYVYRHPGLGTEKIINRQSEAFSEEVASRLGLDSTLIYIDKHEGWKISHYIENAGILDYHNPAQVEQAIGLMRKLHDAKVKSDFDFDFWQGTLDLIDKTKESHKDFEDFDTLRAQIELLYEKTQKDNVPWVLCHCDCYEPNFLIDEEGNMTLIDWEYSGNDDPSSDMGTFICCSDYTYEEALWVLELYHGGKPDRKQLRHDLAYIAIASYHWYIWAIYQESLGNAVGEFLFIWYKYAKEYMKHAMDMYEEDEI
ncbi:MAG: phosphotransferase [Lachnospiraceae bacterium]|jgi:CTP:phosphocholine cytidylyltransferase-like protein/thiamine kinase-like enzyme